ncbi:MAG: helix-turn-helix domain-containing protein [Dysgonomonas sp.]|nr:helix-turn-helix domain-containing protein [Dysgonomonas sp.]
MNRKNTEIGEKNICAVDYAFQRIGGKYKGRILWGFHSYKEVIRYGELRKAMGDISPKMLTQTLRALEDDGLIHREVYHQVPPKVEYSLTETGKELIPFIEYLLEWGKKQLAKNEFSKISKMQD